MGADLRPGHGAIRGRSAPPGPPPLRLRRAPGRALADAAAQQRLRVQNLESLKVVEGVAESEGVVRVSL